MGSARSAVALVLDRGRGGACPVHGARQLGGGGERRINRETVGAHWDGAKEARTELVGSPVRVLVGTKLGSVRLFKRLLCRSNLHVTGKHREPVRILGGGLVHTAVRGLPRIKILAQRGDSEERGVEHLGFRFGGELSAERT